MKRFGLFRSLIAFLLLGMLYTGTTFADVKVVTTTSTELMGMAGKLMNMMAQGAMEQVSVSYVKGNYSRTESDDRITIIDLNKERFIMLNPENKTYSILSFADMKLEMEQAMEEMKESRETEESGEKPDWEVLVDVKKTGKKQKIRGIPAEELIITLTVKKKGVALEDSGGLVITADQWLGKSYPGYDELTNFHRNLAKKMGMDPQTGDMMQGMMSALAGQYPQLGEGMKKLSEEVAKLGNIPLRSVITVEVVPGKKAAAEIAAKDETELPDIPNLRKMFGGFAKKMAKKKSEGGGKNELLKVTSEITDISTQSLDDKLFQIPPDYREMKE